jgi:hypothetical protein
MKSISKDPAERFQTGDEMAQPLKKCRRQRESDSLPLPRATERPKRNLMKSLIAFGLIAVVGAFVYLFMINNWGAKSVLTVKSKPTGANVFLNGSLKGKTPLAIKLPLGSYEIKLSRENFYEWEAQLQLDEEGETPLFVHLSAIDETKP